MILSAPNPWLPLRQPNPAALTRLFCFPHAGGNAQGYRGWVQRLGPECEVCAVQLPGRWSRIQEPPISDLPALVESAVEGFADCLGDHFALFGHSVGAVIAFEFARALRRRGLRGPRRIWAAARRGPQFEARETPIAQLTDSALLHVVADRYGAIPKQVLNDRGMLEMILPVLRADLALDQNYRYTPEPPLQCPISVLGGFNDQAANRDALEGWRAHSAAGFEIRMFPGGHFFPDSEREAVLRLIDGYWRDDFGAE